MAWTTPRTWVVAETVTAAEMNTHVRDNELFLYSFHGCNLFHSVDQSIGSNPGDSFQAIALDSEAYDTDGLHDPVTNNTRITIPAGLAGYWEFIGVVEFAPNAGGSVRESVIRLNGVTILRRSSESAAPTTAVAVRREVYTQYLLAAGDYVELGAGQNTGGGLNAQGGSIEKTALMARWLGG